MKYVGNVQSQANSEVYATASGTLPNGTPVVVNSDGTVSVVSGTDQVLGSPTNFNSSGSGNVSEINSVFDPDNNKVVLIYQNGGDSYHGYAIVGTISGTSVTFGTAVEFVNAIAGAVKLCYDTNSNKFVIIYADYGNSYYGTARVGTISGTNISFGTAVVYKSSTVPNNQSIVFDSNANKVIIAFGDNGNSVYGTAVVGTVSGTNISFGTAVVFHSADTNNIRTTFDSTANKVIIIYRVEADSQKGKAIVGTVSGTGISFGSEAVYASSTTSARHEIMYNSDSNKTLIVYPSAVSPYYTVAVVGTISGTSISFGTSVNIETTSGVNDANSPLAIAYDPDAQKYSVVMEEYLAASGYNGHLQEITISGTTPVIGGRTVFLSSRISNTGAGLSYDTSSDTFLLSYTDISGGIGKAMTVKLASSNLTAENFVGITNGVVEYINQEIGSEAVFENSGITNLSSGFDSNSNRVVVAYGDSVNSDYGTAAVGTVSGTSISFGTPVVFEAGQVSNPSVVFDSSNNKVVIVYADANATMHGHAIVGTVDPSDNSISFGTAAVFEASSVGSFSPGATFDSNSNKVVIVYSNGGNSNYGTAKVATVSGTSISFGTAAVFSSTSSDFVNATFDSNSNKAVIIFRNGGNSNYGTAVVGTVSGTNISYGSLSVFNAGSTTYNACIFDSDLNKVLVAFRDAGNSNKGTAVIGTVSGTSISFGSEVVFNDAVTPKISATYDTLANKVVIAYQDEGNSDKGTFVIGTISGTSISFGSGTIFHNTLTDQPKAVFDSSANKVVIPYKADGDGNKGKAVVVQVESETRGSTASGSTAIIQAGGAVNTLQTGLTPGQQYFVQTDGTLGLTAGSPSVIAGTAVSATDLIVKG